MGRSERNKVKSEKRRVRRRDERRRERGVGEKSERGKTAARGGPPFVTSVCFASPLVESFYTARPFGKLLGTTIRQHLYGNSTRISR